MYCTNCAASLGPTDLFCSYCGTRVKSPDAAFDDIQYISASARAPSMLLARSTISTSMPLVRVSYTFSSTPSYINEARVQKAATTKLDRANSKRRCSNITFQS
jgi:hypothetical protein